MRKKKHVWVAALGIVGLAAMTCPTPAKALAATTTTDQGDVNLALGKPWSTSTPVGDSLFSYYEQAWFPHVNGVLTDGKYAQPFFYEPDWSVNPEWEAFVLQDDHSVVVDLGEVDTVHKITQDYMNDPNDGVYLPERVIYSVSLDGVHWERVGNVPAPIPLTTQTPASALYAQDGLNVQARYVRAQFPADFYAFSDEIQVLGQQGVQPDAAAPHDDPHQTDPDHGFATLQSSNDAHILLSPLWLADRYNQAVYPWNLTAQQWLPEIAYLDQQGNVKDWLFNSILAARGAGSSNKTQADWQTWMNHLFNLGPYANPATPTELPALDQAAGTAKAALNDPAYKEDVIVAIPYPDPSVSNWGSINGGSTLNFSNESDREAAVAWFIQQVEQYWQQANFQNLRLAGFYWENESVYINQPGEVQLIQHTADLIHQANQKFYWIPYFEAPGYKIWNRLGFDVAMLQPNYAFANVSQVRLTEAAELAHHYGLGLEMEFPNRVTNPGPTSATNVYLQYQDAGVAYQFASGTPLTWYQGTQSVLKDYQQQRVLYDLIHQFMTGTYSPQTYQSNNGSYSLVPDQPDFTPLAPLDIPAGINQLQGNMINAHEKPSESNAPLAASQPWQFAHQPTPHEQAEQDMESTQ